MKTKKMYLTRVTEDERWPKEKERADLEENQALETEHARLKEEFLKIQLAVEEEQKELEVMKGRLPQKKSSKGQKPAGDEKEAALKKFEDNILLLQSKNSYLTKVLLELEETQPARKLQSEDLQYQKKSLEMEAKLKDFSLQQAQSKRAKELSQLKEELQNTIEEKQKLSQAVQDIELKKAQYPPQIEQFKTDNARLEKRLAQLSAQKDLKQKEVELLKTKRMYLTRVMEEERWPKEKEKADLEGKIEQLESQLEALNKTMDTSLASQQNKRKLTEELIKIDSDNQALRDKIADLKIKVEGAH